MQLFCAGFVNILLAGDMLAHEHLPESLIELGLDVLQVTLPDEREFIRVIVEIVADLQDHDDHVEAEITVCLDSFM
jgi:hypothetical protein